MAIISNGNFGKTADGREVRSYTLSNSNGSEAVILDYGCIIQSLKIKNKAGEYKDVVLGYDDVAGYEKNEGYLGAAIGRFGNRIAKGAFTLEGKEYHLYINNGVNALHGGKAGFNSKVWDADTDGDKLILTYYSADMEEGYPAGLKVKISYELTDDDSLAIKYFAESDGTTVINLTNHSYFNISGDPAKSIADEYIKINADYITETDEGSIPNGNLMPVCGTPFDLRTEKRIGDGFESSHQQIVWGGGYDHNFALGDDRLMKEAAVVYDSASGIEMKVYTDQPGVQFYTANFLSGATGKKGIPNDKRHALCLETQNYPDAPNHKHFPSSVLRKGDLYQYTTVYKFSVR